MVSQLAQELKEENAVIALRVAEFERRQKALARFSLLLVQTPDDDKKNAASAALRGQIMTLLGVD